MQSRKVEFQMYYKKSEELLLDLALGLYCRVTNTLLEEHRRRYEAGEKSYNFTAMCRDITSWRKTSDSLNSLNAQSLQMAAKRVSKSFDDFFRRVKAKETPGYPRFKSVRRFKGWGYKSHGDGWKLQGCKAKLNSKNKCSGYTYSSVRLSGIGTLRIRGKARFYGVPKTAEVVRRHGKWYLSVTFQVEDEQLKRSSGQKSMGFDWGINTLLTQVVGDPLTGDVNTVENPRWLKTKLKTLIELQKAVSTLESKAISESGKTKAYPVSVKLRRYYDKVRKIHRQIAKQRHDFYHKLTAALVSEYGLIATEKLNIANMVKKPEAKKEIADSNGCQTTILKKPSASASSTVNSAGLRRSNYDAAGGILMQMLRYKAVEADTKLYEHPTKKLKPSQRCCLCGKTQKMPLEVRVYTCECGNVMPRDINSARTVLRYTYEGEWWVNSCGMGTVPMMGLQS